MPIISKELFRRIEHELYNYQEHVRELNEARAEVLYGTPHRFEGKSKGCASDPTAVRGIKLARLDETEQAKWVECIHDALEAMPTEYKMLVKYRYFDRMRPDMVARKLHISRSLFFKWRENIVLHIVLLATERDLVRPSEKAAG